MVSKLEMPGFLVRLYFTSLPESVVADMIFLVMSSGLSNKEIYDFLSSDLDIFFLGSTKLMILAPSLGMRDSGSLNIWPNFWLNFLAMERVNSTCCSWSLPTGTPSDLYSKISAAISKIGRASCRERG